MKGWETMGHRWRLVLVGALLATTVAGFAVWSLYGGGSGPRRLTVLSALRLCPAQGIGHIGTVTIDGYSAHVSVTGLTGGLGGLFPTRGAAETASRDRYGLYPPLRKAIWLRGERMPQGVVRVSATGKLDCIFQLPGMGDSPGTFAWLRIGTFARLPEKA